MTKQEFITFLEANNIPYEIADRNIATIYVYGKPEDIISFDGRKTKFIPYLRVSHFDEKPGMCYTRDCGLCEYHTDTWIKGKCIELRDGRSVE